MFNINWEKENKLTNKFFCMITVSWFICGLALGVTIGVVT